MVIFSKLPDVIGQETFQKLTKNIAKRLNRYKQLSTWSTEADDLSEEMKKLQDGVELMLNDYLLFSYNLIMANFTLRNFQRINMISVKEDNFLAEKQKQFQLLKGEISRYILDDQYNASVSNRLFENSVKLIQDLRNYELEKSHTPLLNDWIDNEYLIEKALKLDMIFISLPSYKQQLKPIKDLLHQMKSTDVNEKER